MMTKPPEVLYTERLALRAPRPSDAAAIFRAYAADAEVTRFLQWRPHSSVGETEEYVAGCVAAWGGDSRFPWVLELREGGGPLGMVELRVAGFKADVGYVLGRASWGRGLATEALRPVVGWAMAQPGIYRVWAVCDAENVASSRVLEKAGMTREGLLRRYALHPNVGDEPRDSLCYALTK
jgi:ribosomal-protein-alanine N-acetyltransferase